jgi:hypothetical protein
MTDYLREDFASSKPKFRLNEGRWGFDIYFMETLRPGVSPLRVAGHWTPRPKPGEVLVDKAGKRYVFVQVEYCQDPRDMFFATVTPETK